MATVEKRSVFPYTHETLNYQGESSIISYTRGIKYGTLQKAITTGGAAQFYVNQIIPMSYTLTTAETYDSFSSLTITDNAFDATGGRLQMIGETTVTLGGAPISGLHPAFNASNQMSLAVAQTGAIPTGSTLVISFNVRLTEAGTAAEVFGAAPEYDCRLVLTSGGSAESVELTPSITGALNVTAQPYVLGIALAGTPASGTTIYDGDSVIFTLTLTGDEDPTRVVEGTPEESTIAGGTTVINLNPEFVISGITVTKDGASDTTTFGYATNAVSVNAGQTATFNSTNVGGTVTATEYVITINTNYQAQ